MIRDRYGVKQGDRFPLIDQIPHLRVTSASAPASASVRARGELLAQRWEDVDLKTGTLRVRATVQRLGKRVGLVIGTPKTGRSRRTLPLPRVLVDALTEHRTAQTREREEAGKAWRDVGLVFTTSRGTMIEPRNLNRSLDEAIARAGMRRIRFQGPDPGSWTR